ncbi:hypothetical protein FRC03_009790 [Tulasnella sp. 419]|nr:hypothetical protein FRC03_009790 [Tulasnella sp. 419]
MASTKVFTLNDGHNVPAVGLGCWMGYPGGGEDAEQMVKQALKLGYRHFDTAFGYDNEEHVGKAIRESHIPRHEIFLTTKLHQKHHGDVQKGFEESLRNLGVDYIDLYLMHWPQASDDHGKIYQPDESPTYIETWKAMEKLLETGNVKSIGVSNFSVKLLNNLLQHTTVVPAVNQVQLHPMLPQNDLLEFCNSKGIHLTAYMPLGRADSPFFTNDQVKAIADKNNASVAQILLSWGVQRGTSVIPKSVKEERLKQNLTTITLSEEDFQALNNFHKQAGMHRQLMITPLYDQEKGTWMTWTHEQMGWNWDKDGNVLS